MANHSNSQTNLLVRLAVFLFPTTHKQGNAEFYLAFFFTLFGKLTHFIWQINEAKLPIFLSYSIGIVEQNQWNR